MKLPAPVFVPRLADLRTGTFSELVAGYGAPLDALVTYRLATRFRLEKTDPTAARSPVKNPRKGCAAPANRRADSAWPARNGIFVGISEE